MLRNNNILNKNNTVGLGVIVCTLAMTAIVLLSNILVQFMYGNWLTYGAFTYPFAFLVTDLTNRFYGPLIARRVVFVGFGFGILCSLAGTQILGEFGPLITFRIALGSGVAFLFAQLVDVFIYNRMRDYSWWCAPLGSTLVGSSLDTVLFFGIAFSSSMQFINPNVDVGWANETVPLLGVSLDAPLWVSLAVADFFVKLSLALLALIPFRIVIMNLNLKWQT